MIAHWLQRLRSVDLRELDVENLGSWSPRCKVVMALGWVGVLLGLGYALLLQPPIAQLQQQRETQAALKTEFESKALQVANLDAYLMHMQGLENVFSALLQQLPSQAEVPGLLEEVSRLGLASGLVIESIQWSPEVLRPFYAQLPLQMTLAGGYHDLGLFVSGLASLPRIVTLHDFELVPLSQAVGSPLRMTLVAKTYRVHDQAGLPQ